MECSLRHRQPVPCRLLLELNAAGEHRPGRRSDIVSDLPEERTTRRSQYMGAACRCASARGAEPTRCTGGLCADGGVNIDVRAQRARPAGGGMVENRQRNTVAQHLCRGGGHLHSLLQLTEDQAAAAGAAPLEARDDAREQATRSR